MSIQAVLFDFGGVLVRTHDHTARRAWDARLGLPPGSIEEIVFASPAAARATTGELPVEAVWEHIMQALSLDAAGFREFRREFFAGDRLDTDLVDFLRRLRPRYKTAILSNAWSNARPMFVEDFGLGDAVDEFIISAEVGVAKPAARIYHLAAEKLNTPITACLFVDDVLKNVEAARAAGMQAVHFDDPARARREVEELLAAG